MKVILLQDVAKLGRRFEIVEVPDGYGVNKLIPKGLAKPATPANIKAVQARNSAVLHQKEAASGAFSELVAALKDVTVTVAAKANAEGKLFKAVHADEVVAAIMAATGARLRADQVIINEPIKHTGEVTISIAEGTEQVPLTLMVVGN